MTTSPHTPLPQQEQVGQEPEPLEAQAELATPTLSPEPSPPTGGTSPADSAFYLMKDDPHEQEGVGTGTAMPFQFSDALSSFQPGAQDASPLSAPVSALESLSTPRFPFLRVLIIVGVAIIVLLVGTLVVLAQTFRPTLPTRPAAPMRAPVVQPHKAVTSTPAPVKKAVVAPAPQSLSGPNMTTSQQGAGSWLPKRLPAQWLASGLGTADALQAERTATLFTDEEMSLDARSVGTRAHHGGSFTASVFLLTPHAKLRFAHNDLRAIDNRLFDKVQRQQLVQTVINPQPQLTAFTIVRAQRLAWVNVAFVLWHSQMIGGKVSTGFDLQPGTRTPRVHHMQVLLLRVSPQAQGVHAPAGGTGWLVSTYALDGPPPTLIQPA